MTKRPKVWIASGCVLTLSVLIWWFQGNFVLIRRTREVTKWDGASLMLIEPSRLEDFAGFHRGTTVLVRGQMQRAPTGWTLAHFAVGPGGPSVGAVGRLEPGEQVSNLVVEPIAEVLANGGFTPITVLVRN